MSENQICSDSIVSRAQLRRRKLVETARKLFIENGFHATGIAQIAQQSGIAVGQIYRDFCSKEEIVSALVKEDCARFMDAATLRMALAADDKAGVLAWLQHFVQPVDDIGIDRMFAEIVAESSRNPRIAAIFTTLQAELHGHLLTALTPLAPHQVDSGRRSLVADTIMTVSLGLLHHRLFRPDLEIAPLVESLQAIISRQIEDLTMDPTEEFSSGTQ